MRHDLQARVEWHELDVHASSLTRSRELWQAGRVPDLGREREAGIGAARSLRQALVWRAVASA